MDEKTRQLLEGTGKILNLDAMEIDLGLIKADSKVPRSFICAGCGEEIPNPPGAYHVKPEVYVVKYKGLIFYLERHLCVTCQISEGHEEATGL